MFWGKYFKIHFCKILSFSSLNANRKKKQIIKNESAYKLKYTFEHILHSKETILLLVIISVQYKKMFVYSNSPEEWCCIVSLAASQSKIIYMVKYPLLNNNPQ